MNELFVVVPLMFIREGKKQRIGSAVLKRDTYEIVRIKVDQSVTLADEEKELLNIA